MNTLKLEIVTPEGQIFSNDVKSVTLPGSEGEFGVLPHHASLVTLLNAGIIDIELKKMNQFSQKMRNNILKNIVFTKNKKDLITFCNKKLQKNEIVQVVSGNMEFGPRALCNTSTLSLPYVENVEIINSLNKRNTVMPMACLKMAPI